MIIENYTIFDNIEDVYQKYYPTKSHRINSNDILDQIYNPQSELIWVIKDYDDDFEIGVYDKNANKLSSMILQNTEYGYTSPILTLLPNLQDISVSLLDGQDGSETYFLKFDKQIIIDKTLDDNLDYLLAIENNTALICWDFYDGLVFKLSYPDMKVISQVNFYDFDEDWTLNPPIKLNEHLTIITNGVNDRNYFFDTRTMTLGDELRVMGCGLRELDGEMVSDVTVIGYESNRLIFHVYQNGKKYYLVSDEIIF